MGYIELIEQVKKSSGFTNTESEEALIGTVESIAERLSADERKDFASQLPVELQEVALSVNTVSPQEDIIEDFMETYDVAEDRAKQRLLAAWNVIKKTLSLREVRHIRAQMTKNTLQILH